LLSISVIFLRPLPRQPVSNPIYCHLRASVLYKIPEIKEELYIKLFPQSGGQK
jgi:hypothetical protein